MRRRKRDTYDEDIRPLDHRDCYAHAAMHHVPQYEALHCEITNMACPNCPFLAREYPNIITPVI